MAELFAPSVDSPIPLAVLDDAGRLVGVIPRVALLASMASAHGDNSATAEDPPATPEEPASPPAETAVADGEDLR